MERSQILETMSGLKLFGMKAAYDEIIATAVKRQHEPQRIVGDLACFFRHHPEALPEGWQRGEGETARLRGIGDYIAGMTDRFAIARHEALIGPVNLPDRF